MRDEDVLSASSLAASSLPDSLSLAVSPLVALTHPHLAALSNSRSNSRNNSPLGLTRTLTNGSVRSPGQSPLSQGRTLGLSTLSHSRSLSHQLTDMTTSDPTDFEADSMAISAQEPLVDASTMSIDPLTLSFAKLSPLSQSRYLTLSVDIDDEIEIGNRADELMARALSVPHAHHQHQMNHLNNLHAHSQAHSMDLTNSSLAHSLYPSNPNPIPPKENDAMDLDSGIPTPTNTSPTSAISSKNDMEQLVIQLEAPSTSPSKPNTYSNTMAISGTLASPSTSFAYSPANSEASMVESVSGTEFQLKDYMGDHSLSIPAFPSTSISSFSSSLGFDDLTYSDRSISSSPLQTPLTTSRHKRHYSDTGFEPMAGPRPQRPASSSAVYDESSFSTSILFNDSDFTAPMHLPAASLPVTPTRHHDHILPFYFSRAANPHAHECLECSGCLKSHREFNSFLESRSASNVNGFDDASLIDFIADVLHLPSYILSYIKQQCLAIQSSHPHLNRITSENIQCFETYCRMNNLKPTDVIKMSQAHAAQEKPKKSKSSKHSSQSQSQSSKQERRLERERERHRHVLRRQDPFSFLASIDLTPIRSLSDHSGASTSSILAAFSLKSYPLILPDTLKLYFNQFLFPLLRTGNKHVLLFNILLGKIDNLLPSTQPLPSPSSSKPYLTHSHLKPLCDEFVRSNPYLSKIGLDNNMQSRYSQTILALIFYYLDRKNTGRISLFDLSFAYPRASKQQPTNPPSPTAFSFSVPSKTSEDSYSCSSSQFFPFPTSQPKHSVSFKSSPSLLHELELIEESGDPNSSPHFFSFSGFFVLFSRFSELDANQDGLLSFNELSRYENESLTKTICLRIIESTKLAREKRALFHKQNHCGPCPSPSRKLDTRFLRFTKEIGTDFPSMNYEEFIHFLVSEVDKSSTPALNYWFSMLDLDQDSRLSFFELDYFFLQDQIKRHQDSTTDTVRWADIIHQTVDMIKGGSSVYSDSEPMGRASDSFWSISKSDLAQSNLQSYFFNLFFNTSRLHVQESRDPVRSHVVHLRQQENITDWSFFVDIMFKTLHETQSMTHRGYDHE